MIIRIMMNIYRILQRKRDTIKYARSLGVIVGDNCRILGMTDATFGSEPYLIVLGDHVTITSGVSFVTHDGGVWILRNEFKDIEIVSPITVGNNVFIGINSIIMPGVSIGNNSIIAAGSVVTRNVLDGMVVGGVPAKPIKTVAEYRESILNRALHIRGLSPEAKRTYLLEHFRQKDLA